MQEVYPSIWCARDIGWHRHCHSRGCDGEPCSHPRHRPNVNLPGGPVVPPDGVSPRRRALPALVCGSLRTTPRCRRHRWRSTIRAMWGVTPVKDVVKPHRFGSRSGWTTRPPGGSRLRCKALPADLPQLSHGPRPRALAVTRRDLWTFVTLPRGSLCMPRQPAALSSEQGSLGGQH